MEEAKAEKFLRALASANKFHFRWADHEPRDFFGCQGFEIYGQRGAIWAHGDSIWMGLWATTGEELRHRVNEVSTAIYIKRGSMRRDEDRHYVYFKIDQQYVYDAATFILADFVEDIDETRAWAS